MKYTIDYKKTGKNEIVPFNFIMLPVLSRFNSFWLSTAYLQNMPNIYITLSLSLTGPLKHFSPYPNSLLLSFTLESNSVAISH